MSTLKESFLFSLPCFLPWRRGKSPQCAWQLRAHARPSSMNWSHLEASLTPLSPRFRSPNFPYTTCQIPTRTKFCTRPKSGSRTRAAGGSSTSWSSIPPTPRQPRRRRRRQGLPSSQVGLWSELFSVRPKPRASVRPASCFRMTVSQRNNLLRIVVGAGLPFPLRAYVLNGSP